MYQFGDKVNIVEEEVNDIGFLTNPSPYILCDMLLYKATSMKSLLVLSNLTVESLNVPN